MESKNIVWLCLLALFFGAVGETLSFFRRQCVQVEQMLLEDFRVLAFAAPDLPDNREKIVEEKIRVLAGVQDVRFVSRDTALDELKAEDPEMVQSLALMGENPLPPAFEIRLAPEAIGQISSWVESVTRMPELSDVRFKPLEVRAILQMEFYQRFIDLALSLAGMIWFLGAAAGLWFGAQHRDPRRLWKELKPRFEYGLVFTFVGMGLVYMASYPLRGDDNLWAWPTLQAHIGLALAGMLGAGLWPEARSTPRKPEKHHPDPYLVPDENIALPTDS